MTSFKLLFGIVVILVVIGIGWIGSRGNVQIIVIGGGNS
jgi:hypothetical protein